jgi:RNA polymerase sigma factor (sigma-70 family)
MHTIQPLTFPMTEKDRHLTETVSRERGRLRNFIRRRVPNPGDAEDILQEVFYEATIAYRLPEPIEQFSAWMYRVALNRITDLFRKKKPELLEDILYETDEEITLDDIFPSISVGPEEIYARAVILEALYAALDELPADQRDVFIAHEIDGHSFKELNQDTGIPVNTLLSRKRYAISFLRERMQIIYNDLINL